jgi:hypothetical protein
MKLDSVRELKSTLPELIRQRFAQPEIARAAGVAVARAASAETALPTYALGVSHSKTKGFRLALRLQSRALEKSDLVDYFTERSKGEIDVRYIGRVSAGAKRVRAKAQAAGFRSKQRPLMIGYSCGFQTPGFVMAGTLGCFVRKGTKGRVMILSNNHVLADENALPLNSPIFQPGLLDGGKAATDRVAKLTKFLRLRPAPFKNPADCAVATLDEGQTYDPIFITGVGNLVGVAPALPDVNERVHKAGRTTGTTHGRVTAFEVDGVTVGYDFGTAVFDNQIEIEGEGAGPFSMAGDSGSMIVDDSMRATALLFAGSDHGGSNNAGLTYANPFSVVLKKLGVKLVLT